MTAPVQAASSRSAVIRNPSQKRTHLPAANSIMSLISRTIDLRGFNWQAFLLERSADLTLNDQMSLPFSSHI